MVKCNDSKKCTRKCATCEHLQPRSSRWCTVKAITVQRPHDPVDCRCWHEAQPLTQIFLRAKPPHGEAPQADGQN